MSRHGDGTRRCRFAITHNSVLSGLLTASAVAAAFDCSLDSVVAGLSAEACAPRAPRSMTAPIATNALLFLTFIVESILLR